MAAKKIEDIQVLRGLAIVMVLTTHLSLSATLWGYLPVHLTKPLYSGVELFFIISGYVVTLSLMHSGYRPISFMVRRMARLWPPMLAFLAFSFVVNQAIAHFAPPFAVQLLALPTEDFVRQAVQILIGTFINDTAHPGYTNGAMWSLSVEFQFYAAMAILCALGLICRLRGDALAKLIGIAAVVTCGATFLGRLQSQIGVPPIFGPYLSTFNFDFMAAGVLLAFLPDRVRLHASRFGWRTSCILLVIPLVILSLCNSSLVTPKYNSQVGIGFLACILFFTALITIAATDSLHWHHRIKSVLLAIGERSYTIYLIHFPCMALAWLMIYTVNPIWAARPLIYGVLQATVTILLLTPLTWAMYRWIEKPSQHLGARIINGWRRREAVQQSL